MLSVIIPTRNRATYLASMLSMLKSQLLSQSLFEILVVDNGSTDETHTIVKDYQSSSENIRYFFDATPGLHVGRHVGLQEAKGDILVYADDDIEATPGWLAAIAECFADPEVALVGGNNLPKFAIPPPEWLLRLWLRPFLDGHAIPALSILELPAGQREISPFHIWGCNFSIRKQVLLDAGGFHPDGMPLDLIRFRGDGETHVSNYVSNSGLKTLFDSRASVYHLVTAERMTKEYFCRRYFAQGISDSYSEIRKKPDIARNNNTLNYLLRSVKNRLRYGKKLLITHDPIELSLSRITYATQQAYLQGYKFHRKEVLADPDLLDWVLKEHYW